MAFTMPQFEILSGDEQNPLSGIINKSANVHQNLIKSRYAKPNAEQDLLTKQIANQISQIQAKYADANAQQDLQTKVLTNQWYGPEKQSEIGLRGAQTAYANQQTKFYPQVTQSEIALRNAQAAQANVERQMNQMKLNYISQAIAPGQQQSPQLPSDQSQPVQQQVGQPQPSNQGAMQSGMQPGMQQSPQPGMQSSPQQPMQQPIQQQMQPSMNRPSQQPVMSPQTVSNALQQNPQPQSNSIYGIETATPTREDNINKMMFGIDTFTPKLTLSKEQQAQQLKLYQDDISSSNVNASKALEQKQELSMFNNAMDRSLYRGQRFGDVKTDSWTAKFLPGDMTPEQEADRAANKMIPSAMAELTDVMGKNHFSNLDMKSVQNMKFNRSMNDETRKLYSAFTNGVIARSQEKVKFLTALSDPKTGPQKRYADAAWRSYQEEFPLTKDTKEGFKYLGEDNLNKWPIFITPKAIESIKRNGFYKPTKAEREANYMLMPDTSGQYHIMPIKKDMTEQARKYGAMDL